MGSAERAKGQRAERAVAAFLRDHGWDAITTRQQSGFQLGDDIATNAPLSIEVKDHARLDLAGWIRQAHENATDGRMPVVWHKRRGAGSPGDWYVTMKGSTLMEMIGDGNDSGDDVRR